MAQSNGAFTLTINTNAGFGETGKPATENMARCATCCCRWPRMSDRGARRAPSSIATVITSVPILTGPAPSIPAAERRKSRCLALRSRFPPICRRSPITSSTARSRFPYAIDAHSAVSRFPGEWSHEGRGADEDESRGDGQASRRGSR